jgi:hypothetical protein
MNYSSYVISYELFPYCMLLTFSYELFIICIYFNLYIYDNDNSDNDESTEFWDMVLGATKLSEKYVELYLDKNPQRIAEMSGMGWVLFVLKTPGECHTQLRMNTEMCMDLHDLLVSRYGL